MKVWQKLSLIIGMLLVGITAAKMPVWANPSQDGTNPAVEYNDPNASSQATSNQDNNWQKPVVTLGVSLTPEQRQQTIATLTQSLDGASYDTLPVNGATLVKYLNPAGDDFTNSSPVWSSAMVQKTNSGGINVHILKFHGHDNITTITADQYRNAAITAGVTNANIYVTSAVPIDGSGALAGVYAAFAQNGDALNQQQITAAQDEVKTLSGITQANKNKQGYTDAQLNHAVAGMKAEMARQSNNGQQTLSQNQIGNIVDSQLKDNQIAGVINNNQRTQIINLLVKIQASGALKKASFKNQANKLSISIRNGAKKIFDEINTPQAHNWFAQLWQNIVNFFQNLFGNN